MAKFAIFVNNGSSYNKSFEEFREFNGMTDEEAQKIAEDYAWSMASCGCNCAEEHGWYETEDEDECEGTEPEEIWIDGDCECYAEAIRVADDVIYYDQYEDKFHTIISLTEKKIEKQKLQMRHSNERMANILLQIENLQDEMKKEAAKFGKAREESKRLTEELEELKK